MTAFKVYMNETFLGVRYGWTEAHARGQCYRATHAVEVR